MDGWMDGWMDDDVMKVKSKQNGMGALAAAGAAVCCVLCAVRKQQCHGATVEQIPKSTTDAIVSLAGGGRRTYRHGYRVSLRGRG